MNSGIYMIVNLHNSNCYIGSSSNLRARFIRHKRELRKNTHHSIYLQRAYNKYGSEIFVYCILEFTNSELFSSEEKWIERLSPEYNVGCVGGGDNISNHPNNAQIRAKYSQIQRNRRKNMTQEEKEIMRQKLMGANNPNWKGGIASDNHCIDCNAKISAYKKRCMKCCKKGVLNPFYGKHHSVDTKNKIAKQNRNRPQLRARKPLLADGVQYESITAAARSLGVTPGAIFYRIKSKNFDYHFLEE